MTNEYAFNKWYNYYDFTDITDFSLQVNLKFAGGLDNALHAEPAVGLFIQYTFSKYQLNIWIMLCPEGEHLKVGLSLWWLIKFSDYSYGVCSDFTEDSAKNSGESFFFVNYRTIQISCILPS